MFSKMRLKRRNAMGYDVDKFNVARYEKLLARGLSEGLGRRDGQMCIEAVICTVLAEPHGDTPSCVDRYVRNFKVKLNDQPWSTPKARAEGLHDLGLAQLGSRGTIDGRLFKRLTHDRMLAEGTRAYKRLAALAAGRTDHAIPQYLSGAIRLLTIDLVYLLGWLTELAAALRENPGDKRAFFARAKDDEFLLIAAKTAVEVLKELGSPGCKLLKGAK
jgi:hypothetical protein